MANQNPVPAPRTALFNTATNYLWSDGTTTFNGFLLVELIAPNNGSCDWTELDYGNLSPSIRLPRFQKIPIVNGQINASCAIFLNSDIVPPDSQYVCWYYDSSNRKIAGPSTTFTVTSTSAFTPPQLTLTIPSGLGSQITPDSTGNTCSGSNATMPGEVLMIHDRNGVWTVLDENDNKIDVSASKSQGLQEAINYAQAHGFHLRVLGGGVTPPSANVDVSSITTTVGITVPTSHNNSYSFHGVDVYYLQNDATDLFTFDTFDDLNWYFDGQIIYSGTGAAVRLKPVTDNGETFIGGTSSKFYIKTIAIVDHLTKQPITTQGIGIKASSTNGTIKNVWFDIGEINGGDTGILIDNPGATFGFVYNRIVCPAIHQQGSYGIRAGTSSLSGGSINGNIWDCQFTGGGASSKAISIWGDSDLWRVSIGAASVGIELNSSATSHRIQYAWNNATTAYTNGSTSVNFINQIPTTLTRNTPTVSASPYTFQNTTGRPMFVFVSGTSSAIAISNDNSTFDSASSPPTNSYYYLHPNQYLKITYGGAAPSVFQYY